MDDKRIDKKGQLTVWVIVALVIVAVIILFFLLQRNFIKPGIETVKEDPRSFISQCVKKNANEAVDIMLHHGGFIMPLHSKLYSNINISYLCYNSGNYNPCINEHPMLLNEMKEEITKYIGPRVEQCFEDYRNEMGKRNIRVSFNAMNLNIELGKGRIYVDIKRDINVEDKGEQKRFNEFNIELISPLYDLAKIAIEITSQETKYCYFEYVGYMILYPRFKISKFQMSDSTKIYTIKDKNSDKEMNIAIRSCAISPGL